MDVKTRDGGTWTLTISVILIVIAIIWWVLNCYGFLIILFHGQCNYPLSQTHPQRHLGNVSGIANYCHKGHRLDT